MKRDFVEIGTVVVEAGGTGDIAFQLGHEGTVCGIQMLMYNGTTPVAATATNKTAIESIKLSLNEEKNGRIEILPSVPVRFLYFREQFYGASRGVVNSGAMVTYNPSAAFRAGEGESNIRDLGTKNLKDMVLRYKFGQTITGLTRIVVIAEIDYNLKDNLGTHTRIGYIRVPVPASGGKVELTTLPVLEPDFAYDAFHLDLTECPGLTVDSYTLYINGIATGLQDTPKASVDRALLECHRTPQADFASIDFAKEDNARYYLPGGMSSIKLVPNFVAAEGAVAGHVTCWYEQIRKA